MSVSWLIWRQARVAVAIALIALLALAVVIVIDGLHLHHAYDLGLARCRSTGGCSDLQKQLFRRQGTVIELINLTVLAPALIGMFLGAPLVARELEHGTDKLVWTQAITRRRWFLAKLGWLGLFAVLWSAAIAVLVTWWSGPLNALGGRRFWPGQFDIQGLVPGAYALFAFVLATTAGTLARRTLVGVGVTIGGFAGVRLLIRDYVRQRYLRAVTTPLRPGPHATYAAQGNWTLNVSTNLVSRRAALGHGHAISPLTHSGCHVSHFACLAAAGIRQLFTYQPGGRYWTFQTIEALLFLAISGALAMTALTAVQRVDG
jgi:hypothetical protein